MRSVSKQRAMEIIAADKEKDSAFAHLSTYIDTSAEEAQVEVSAELVTALRQMLNNPDFSDVVFLWNDGIKVSASRMHLASRSDVLKNLLRNGMIESSLAEIKLPEVSSPVMLSVLEFLYTGTLHSYSPQSWKMGWEVIIASQFFLLPKLEIIVRKFMHAQMVSVAYDFPGAAILLTEALGFEAIREQGHNILMELITILNSNWPESVFVENLSEDVFHYFLVHTSRNFEMCTLSDDIRSFREYLRFRQVIHWWVCGSDLGSHSKEEVKRLLVPDKEEVMSICERPLEVLEALESPNEVSVRELRFYILHSDEVLRRAAMRLVTNIDYRLIHPAVLARVVEPLKISSGDLLHAFRFHALRRTEVITLPVYRWKKNHSFSTFERGHVIYRISSTVGLAVIAERIWSVNRLYKWELVIEEDCSKSVELGFVHVLDSELDGQLNHGLSSEEFAWVLKFNGRETLVSDGHARRNTWKELQVQHWLEGLRVSFTIDTKKETCSLSINGQDFGVVWEHLNHLKCYYPAMSFGACRSWCLPERTYTSKTRGGICSEMMIEVHYLRI